jgi:hypothetical protein
MNKQTARRLASHLEAAVVELGQAARLVKDECPKDELELWRARLATVMGALVVEGTDPLSREHPSVAPVGLRDIYLPSSE